MLHRRTHPLLDEEGCYGCRISHINFAIVPGGARDQRSGISNANQRERDLVRYRNKRKAGEQPDGTTKRAMDEYDKKTDLWARREGDMLDFNHPDAVKKVKRALTNT